MSKFVIFQFLNGSFDKGFPIKVKIGEDGDRHSTETSVSLPPAPEIDQYYSRWQDIYFNLGFSLRLPLRLEAPVHGESLLKNSKISPSPLTPELRSATLTPPHPLTPTPPSPFPSDLIIKKDLSNV